MQHATMSRVDLPYEDSDVDGSDQTYFFVYDLEWRPVATYRGTDANPKERFIFHNAGGGGLGGRGSSSYIDAVIMRDRDANAGWTSASDATLEERRYYCQNWRADVVALITAGGDVSEWVRYSAYGEATVYPFVNGDYDGSGSVDGDDVIAFYADWDLSAGAADVNRSGGVSSADVTAFFASYDNGYMSTAWTAGGGLPANAGQLSVTSGNRIGYAGYQFDPATEQYHVRHRVYSPEMGRWTRRDPIGYVDGMGVYEYVSNRPLMLVDSSGLAEDPWTLALLYHYFYGGGQPVMIPASVYRSIPGVKRVVSTIKSIAHRRASMAGKALLSSLDCSCDGLGPREISLGYVYQLDRWIPSGGGKRTAQVGSRLPDLEWMLGGHRLHATAYCTVLARCGGGYATPQWPFVAYTEKEFYWYSCDIEFYGTDRFADPLGLWFEPSWIVNMIGNPLANPFDIYTEAWQEAIWGVGFGNPVPTCGGTH